MDWGTIVGVVGIVIGIVVAWIFYYRTKADLDVLKRNVATVEGWIQAGYRIEDDTARTGVRRGRIVKSPDGTIGVHWNVELRESLRIEAKPTAEKIAR